MDYGTQLSCSDKANITRNTIMPTTLTMLSCMWMVLLSWLLQNIAESAMSLTGYDLQRVCFDCCYGTHLNTYEGIQSVFSCSAVCSREPGCEAWQFSADSNECWTNAGRITTANNACSRHVIYGEANEDTYRSPWHYAPCLRYTDCTFPNSYCRRRCECEDGYPYDRRTDSCPTECTEYGETVHGADYQMAYIIPIDDSEPMVTLPQCLNLCFKATKFVCRYVIHYDGNPRKCRMYRHNKLSKPYYVSFGLYRGWTAWDRNCL